MYTNAIVFLLELLVPVFYQTYKKISSLCFCCVNANIMKFTVASLLPDYFLLSVYSICLPYRKKLFSLFPVLVFTLHLLGTFVALFAFIIPSNLDSCLFIVALYLKL